MSRIFTTWKVIPTDHIILKIYLFNFSLLAYKKCQDRLNT